LPAEALLGDSPLSEGSGFTLLMVTVRALEVPPPGAGLNTVTCAEPCEPMSAEVIAACNCVLLTKLVLRLLPFHCTTEPVMKFPPFTVSVYPGLPAETALGDRLLREGTGFTTGMGGPEKRTI